MNKNDIMVKNEETGLKRRMAFLDSLINEHFKNNSFTERDIREEVDTFMFEGHDTTAMAISWTLHLIGLNAEIQDKCHQELDNIFGDNDNQRSIDITDLRDMKYLEACIKEALRLFPSVPFVGRINEQEISVNGFIVPKGVTCLVFLYEVHRDQKYFPEPELYKPERFLDNS
ncbi:MAG TPA: cytochrome P450, partial [Ignavibacteriaceae bacterium]